MTLLDDAEFAERLRTVRRSAFRLELQREYHEPVERETFNRFVAGDRQNPDEIGYLRDWFEQIKDQTARGIRWERVRVQDEPPTDYQRWERWIGAWNIRAGETLRYLTRRQAHEVGLLPAAGDTDWWLIDDETLILMRFDNTGHRVATELTHEPAQLEQARRWRNLAVRYGAPDRPETAVTT